MKPLGPAVIAALCNLFLALALAPLFEGVMRKVTAIVQSRKGPPLLQPFMDIAKLLIKEDIEVGHVPVLQRLSALLSPAAILAVALCLPLFGIAPLSGGADAIVMIYLLTLAGVAVLMAALAAGSSYSLVGMSREMMSMMTLEPIFAVAIIAASFKTKSLRFEDIFSGALWSGGVVSTCMLLVVMLAAFQAFIGRAPFDTTEAETEIMEGPLIEYSGPKLALFKYAHMLKLFVYAGLFTALFVPGLASLHPLAAAGIFIVCQFALVLLATLFAATHARYRIDQAVRYYAILFACAVLSLVVALLGW
jgi:formate hydrogenlyase subunit 4